MANYDNVLHLPLSNVAHRWIAKSSVHTTFHLVRWNFPRSNHARTRHIPYIKSGSMQRSHAVWPWNGITSVGSQKELRIAPSSSLTAFQCATCPSCDSPHNIRKFSGGRWLPASYWVEVASSIMGITHTHTRTHARTRARASLEGFIDQRPSSHNFSVTVVF